jgi:hypothetical protein
MSTDSDRDWLDALGGRARSIENAAQAEGQVLRKMVQAQLEQQADAERATTASIATRDPMRERALIERAKREGLLNSRASWTPMLIAAAIAMVAVGIVWQSFITPETPVVRGEVAAPVQMHATDPAALKRQIVEELRAAGVQATGYEAFDIQGIDADLPRPLTPEVRRVLASHDIPEPADGVLRIEIREKR